MEKENKDLRKVTRETKGDSLAAFEGEGERAFQMALGLILHPELKSLKRIKINV